MRPVISIITPSYNRRHTLPRLWESMRDQTERRFEWIVVDDGSTDDTAAWIKSLGDKRIRYVAQKNQGMHAARNRGDREARGKYVVYIDSDDALYDNETLAVMLADITATADNIAAVSYRVIEADTGNPCDDLTQDRVTITYEDILCGRFFGEFCEIYRIEAARKYPWPRWRNLSTMRVLLMLQEYNVILRTRQARLYHWDSGDNMSNFAGMLKYADDVREAYRELIDTFTDDWRRHCPRQIGKYNFYLAGYEVMSGRRLCAFPPLMKALRFGPARTRLAAAALFFCIPLPRSVCAWLLALRNSIRAWKRRRA